MLPISGGNNYGYDKSIKIIFSDDTIQPLTLAGFPIDIDYKWLRRNIRSLRRQFCYGRTLKFLKGGVYLNEDDFQAQLATYLREGEGQGEGGEDNDEPFFLHCMIGVDILSPDELSREDLRDDQLGSQSRVMNGEGSESMGAIGFDRLRGLGFSEEEINLLRQQFQATYGGEGEEEEGPVDMRAQRELEERWMENDVRADDEDEEFNSIPIGNFKHNVDLLIGITIGFTLGIFSLILIRHDGLFNRRQLMAVYAGVMINIVVCFTRL